MKQFTREELKDIQQRALYFADINKSYRPTWSTAYGMVAVSIDLLDALWARTPPEPLPKEPYLEMIDDLF